MRTLAVLALLALTSCATTPPAAGLAPYCSSEGAFGLRFGPDSEFDGEITSVAYLGDPAFAPFDRVEVARTRLSGIVHQIAGSAHFYPSLDAAASIEESARVYGDLRARIESSGAFAIREVTEHQAFYASIGGGESGVNLWLSDTTGGVSIICTNTAYWPLAHEELPEEVQRSVDESLRRMGRPAPRPAEQR